MMVLIMFSVCVVLQIRASVIGLNFILVMDDTGKMIGVLSRLDPKVYSTLIGVQPSIPFAGITLGSRYHNVVAVFHPYCLNKSILNYIVNVGVSRQELPTELPRKTFGAGRED
jgi:hypothetical protein